MLKKTILMAALIILVLTLVGCNTVKGLGEDIKWTGEKGAEVLEGK